ncbi:hypothetical protein M422DRAFT_276402 [Sphaerobolus stellatus SS14]|uniref:Uncharacterized protein n=1 Tax=Sphaerobolus stellatus (strain SS14) TaxID=990650 RepID=A0A0C9U210_SPHS4|nr:hypothetical protein M422DRAFT_276402 [Sphaerobolus stellatus SS14]
MSNVVSYKPVGVPAPVYRKSKDVVGEKKREPEETERKKDRKVAGGPVDLGTDKSKEKVVVLIVSDSEDKNKDKYVNNVMMEVDQMNIRLHELKLKLKDDDLVSADLLDTALNGCARIISKHNFIAWTCSYNMRELILAHELERGHDAKPILLNADGAVEATDGAKSCRKRRRDESDMSDVESV